jgi:iron complex transport system substrate-binding protein
MAPVYNRIVSLQPSATSIIERLGRTNLLVGVTKWCRDLADVRSLPAVGDCWSAKAEQLQPLSPDLVIGSVPYREQTLTEILKLGVPFLAFAPHRLADVYRDIEAIGALVDARDEAAALVAAMKSEIVAIRNRVAGRPRVRTFCEEWGKPIIVSQEWVRELVEAAGGEFIFAPSARPTSAEIAGQAPDALLLAWCGAGTRVPLGKIVQQRGWSALPAVLTGKAAVIEDSLLNTPGPTLIQGLRAIAAVLHPQVCSDLLPTGRVIFADGGLPSH